jgi:TIR domain
MSESNSQASPGSIFICYRREDSADVTGRIYDRLVDHFGPEHVFMDVEAIRLGYDFRSEIDQTIKVCSIVIIVIGDEWLAQVDGKRRIDDENDRVRIEIETALRREIPIIPVLTRGASHPTKAMLPASLEALAYRHGTSIRHEHFRGDVDSLISQMDKLLARQESTPSKPAEPKERTPPVKPTQTTESRPAIPSVASISAIAASKEPALWTRKRLIIVTAIGATVILLLLAITGLLTRPHPFHKAADTADYQKAAENTDVPSTNIDKPTLLTSNEIRGNGVGEEISYYYTFNAGPGEVKVTVDGKNKNVVGSAIAVEISDLDAKRLLYINLGNTTVGKRKVARSQLGRRQQVILRILLGEGSLDYMVRLEGAGDFNAQRSQ